MSKKSISDSLADSSIFLTGATGFVGGSVLERICQLNPGPRCIYILVRVKKDEDPNKRLQKILSLPLFAGVPSRVLHRIKIIVGDIGSDEADLGIDDVEKNLLIENCTHVYHIAAFISFAAELDHAVKINLRGTRAVLNLAKKMKKLRAMVHVSTAYANCTYGTDNAEFKEQVYPVDVDPVEIIDMVNRLPLKEVEQKYAKFIEKHPNTYAFTKQLTENLLVKEKGNIALSIVRPGIILNSWREPFPGWVDNINSGACGFIAGAGKGIFCTMPGREDMIMDVIPVDMVVSTILASALKAEIEPNKLHVFHCTSGTVNPTTWGEYVNGIIDACREYPSTKNIAWYPRCRLRESQLRNYLVMIIFHLIPAFFIDLVSWYTKPGHVIFEVQRRYMRGCKYSTFFSLRQWNFSRTATDKLIELLPEEEREKYPMDPRLINWREYYKDCVIGTRIYIHKEPAKTLTIARRRMTMLRVIATVAPVLYIAGISWCLTSLLAMTSTVAVIISTLLVTFMIWL